MGAIQVFDAGRAVPEEIPVAPGVTCSVVQFVGGTGMPDKMGVGLAEYRGTWDYTLNYDVAYYILAGSINIRDADEQWSASAGDVVYMARGQSITYEVPGNVCVVFWVSYPGNWEEISELPGRQPEGV